MILDFLKLAVNNLTHRKMRTLLTIVGIFIGIAAVVSLISVGQGMQDSINNEFEKMGSDKIMVLPGGEGGMGMMNMMTAAIKLSEDDLKVINKQGGVEMAGGLVFKTVAVKYKDQVKYTFVSGIPTDSTQEIFDDMESYEMGKGHKLHEGGDKEVIIGHDIAYTDYYNKRPKIRDKIYIMDEPFTVCGILQRIGNSQDDTQLIITLNAANELFNTKGLYHMIMVKVRSSVDPSDLAKILKQKIRRARGEKEGEESFKVQTTEQLMNQVNDILGVVNAVLIVIASISLMVGGIGIMNTMYTSVLERTKEIGLMKAIGARNAHIVILFLFESGMLGMVGGILGVGIGIGLAKIVEIIAIQSGLSMLVISFTPELIFGSIGFSFLVGTLSGLFPAIKAAKLNPVDALRYE
ncbi:MAG: ABC transporter permease [Candidatus Aenigmarchaeota archaeon]|nr:ABC transporter permease [Candidatus Aenigmarchaeota archaeon]